MSTSGNFTTLTCDDLIRSHDAVCLNARKILRNIGRIQQGILNALQSNETLANIVQNQWFQKSVYGLIFVATVSIILLNKFLRICTEMWKNNESQEVVTED